MRRLCLAVLMLVVAAVAAPQLSAQGQDPVISSARQFSQQGNHDTAIAMLRSALTTRPNDAALKAELVAVLGLKEAVLRRQLDALSREIAALRGVVSPSVATVAAGCQGAQPVRVGGNIAVPMKLRDVKPAYPDVAMAQKIEGVVIVQALIGCDGKVADATILRGVPELTDAALGAVRQWEYRPTLLNGAPVPVLMTVTVTFALR